MVTSFLFWIALQKTHWISPNSISPPGSREAHYEAPNLAKNKIQADQVPPEKRETSGGEERNFLGIVNDTEQDFNPTVTQMPLAGEDQEVGAIADMYYGDE